ncbi:hypothetical protein O3P69_002920 [Scylla paramamosain]|uniref:Uncharacterized protein n=1 Tax=Scylla paramamosain TaxID=85552 RepID=A0AAW0UKX4_SCYPA
MQVWLAVKHGTRCKNFSPASKGNGYWRGALVNPRPAPHSPQLKTITVTRIKPSTIAYHTYPLITDPPACYLVPVLRYEYSEGPRLIAGTSSSIEQIRHPRNLWRWEAANWDALRAALRNTDWEEVLSGEVDQQVQRLSELLHALQLRWVPHSNHTTKASDQPWFGPECRAAADASIVPGVL